MTSTLNNGISAQVIICTSPPAILQPSAIFESNLQMKLHKNHPSYIPYFISNGDNDPAFHKLIQSSKEISGESIDLIKRICSELSDNDVERIMTFERWTSDRDPEKWRKRAETWNAREAKYVIECLRFEYKQQHYMYQLNCEDEERTQKEEIEKMKSEAEDGDAGSSREEEMQDS